MQGTYTAIFRGFLWGHLHKFSCVLSLLTVQGMGQKSHRPQEYAEILLKELIQTPVKQKSLDHSVQVSRNALIRTADGVVAIVL